MVHLKVATVPGSIETVTRYDISSIKNNLGGKSRAKFKALLKYRVQNYLIVTVNKTTTNDEFLLVNDPETNTVIFNAQSNIHFM